MEDQVAGAIGAVDERQPLRFGRVRLQPREDLREHGLRFDRGLAGETLPFGDLAAGEVTPGLRHAEKIETGRSPIQIVKRRQRFDEAPG